METNLDYLIKRVKSFFRRVPTMIEIKGIRVGLTEAEVTAILEHPPTKILNSDSNMTYWSWANGDRIDFRAGIVDAYDLHGGTAPVAFQKTVKNNG